jgi:hypothetical protein
MTMRVVPFHEKLKPAKPSVSFGKGPDIVNMTMAERVGFEPKRATQGL